MNGSSSIPVGSSAYMQPMAPPAAFDATAAFDTTDAFANAAPAADDPTIRLNTSILSSSLTSSMVAQLREQGYTPGLVEALWATRTSFPLRIWIVDNSGSMRANDGTRVATTNNNEVTIVKGCSRWTEMQQTVESHARTAACLEIPIVFRLLNDPGVDAGPQQFSIAMNGSSAVSNDLAIALRTMDRATPGGVTPLVEHMEFIRQNIVLLERQLRDMGGKVAITIATDGLPSDSMGVSSDAIMKEFEQKLRSLEGLPVWIVVRLFTDEDHIVKFWNELDAKLELSIEVLDDFASEAAEMYEHNKWLNYGLPLHRMRELGFKNYVLDLLDEKKLSKDEVRQFAKILFAKTEIDESPDAGVDWNGFSKVLDKVNKDEKKQWNAIRSRMEPWIDMKTLQKEYGSAASGGCCVII